jgi:hypothetical protein
MDMSRLKQRFGDCGETPDDGGCRERVIDRRSTALDGILSSDSRHPFASHQSAAIGQKR